MTSSEWPRPRLMRSLGRMVQGLSAMFWGIPLALVASVQSQTWIGWHGFDLVMPACLHGLLLFGLSQMASFQPRVGVWRTAVDRARLAALVNLGLSPFLYFHMRQPEVPHFALSVDLLFLSGLLFLHNYNRVLLSLSAMLPDESLRHDALMLSWVNRTVLALVALGALLLHALSWLSYVPEAFLPLARFADLNGLWISIFPLLMPVAALMTLTWKIKEMVMHGVFGSDLWRREGA